MKVISLLACHKSSWNFGITLELLTAKLCIVVLALCYELEAVALASASHN